MNTDMTEDEMEMWSEMTEKSKTKVITMNESKLQITSVEIHHDRPLIGKVLILPRRSAELFTYKKPWACISISDPHMPNAKIQQWNRVDVLHIKFDDISRIHETYKAITEENAKEILDFTDSVWDKVDLLMIHCNAGMCRSPACGVVISEKYQPNHSRFFWDLYSPNKLVVETLRKVQNDAKGQEI